MVQVMRRFQADELLDRLPSAYLVDRIVLPHRARGTDSNGVVMLRQLLASWVAHDLGHVAQVARVMAKQYRDAVGPWRAYLPILTR